MFVLIICQALFQHSNCGDSTGAVLEHDVRGVRVLAHRPSRRCASDQRTLSCSTSLLTPGFNLDAPRSRSVDDDEGEGDDDDLLEFQAADEESKMEEVSDRIFPRDLRHFSRSSRSSGVERHFSGPRW